MLSCVMRAPRWVKGSMNDDDTVQDPAAEVDENDDGMTIGPGTAKDISDDDDTPG